MSEPLHSEFCDWLARNRASMSREVFASADRVARWLFLLESGADVRERADEAFREFMGLISAEQTAPSISTLAREQVQDDCAPAELHDA